MSSVCRTYTQRSDTARNRLCLLAAPISLLFAFQRWAFPVPVALYRIKAWLKKRYKTPP